MFDMKNLTQMKDARRAGATDTMLTEAAMVAAAMREKATVTHASHLFKESNEQVS